MATLTYNPTLNDWTGTVNINYTVAYDALTNQTTVTFSESNLSYSGKSDYETSSTTTITVTAEDNTSSTATATLSTSGYTVGGDTFTGTPSPSEVIVSHSSEAGTKSITISASTTVNVYLGSGPTLNRIKGSGSTSVTSGTYVPQYSLSISAGKGSTIIVNRISSPNKGAATGNLSSIDYIYHGDKLKISFGAEPGYSLDTHKVNNETFTSENTHTVYDNVNVVSSASVLRYKLYINADSHANVTVTRTESPKASASIGTVLHDDYIYYGDKLSITVTPKSGYEVNTSTLNGGAMESSHTVGSDVTIKVETSLKSYSLTIRPDAHSNISVKRNGTALSGNTIYHFDKLSIVVTAKSGYKIKSAYVNDTDTPLLPDIENPYEVAGDITIFAASSALGFVYIQDGGATPSPYIIYVGSEDGSRLERYRVYIGTESNGVIPY